MKIQTPTRRDFPADPSMPDIQFAAQPENMLAICRANLTEIPEVERSGWNRCNITEAIYQPGRACRIAYELESDDSDRPAIVYARWPAEGRRHASATRITTTDDAFDLFRFPRDRRLRQIRAMRRSDWLFAASIDWCRHRDGAGSMAEDDWRCTPIKYVPESRLVCRLKGKWRPHSGAERWIRAYVRISRINNATEQATRLRELKHALRRSNIPIDVPDVFDAMPEHHLLATEFVRGRTMRDAADENDIDAILNACERIAHLSRANVPTAHRPECLPAPTPAEMLRELSCAASDLTVPARTLIDRMHTPPPVAARVGLCHGDLHAGQIIEKKDRIVVVDWDRACIGDPTRDLCNLISDVEFRLKTKGADEFSSVAVQLRDAWVRGGGTLHAASYAWWRTYADVHRAWGLLRHLRPGWEAACAWLLARAASLNAPAERNS